MICTTRVFPLAVLICMLGIVACSSPPPEPKTGLWHAWLESPGGDLPFALEILDDAGGMRAYLLQ